MTPSVSRSHLKCQMAAATYKMKRSAGPCRQAGKRIGVPSANSELRSSMPWLKRVLKRPTELWPRSSPMMSWGVRRQTKFSGGAKILALWRSGGGRKFHGPSLLERRTLAGSSSTQRPKTGQLRRGS